MITPSNPSRTVLPAEDQASKYIPLETTTLASRMHATHLMDSRELVIDTLLVRMCGVTVLPGTAEPFLRKVDFIRHLPGDLVEYKKYAEFKRRTGKDVCLSIWAVESCNSSKIFWGIIILVCHYIVTMEKKNQCCIWNGSSVHCHSEQGHLLSTFLWLRWNTVTKETYKR